MSNHAHRNRVSRRSFLASAATAGPLILTGRAAWAGDAAPNSRLNIGYIGCGRRAGQLMNLPREARIVGFADVNMRRLEEWQRRGKDARIFQDYREMLAWDEIDAVVVASPDHWHAKHTIDACRAGKDVYVEKPHSLTIKEGRQMVTAAQKHERIVQLGSQQRSDPRNRFACELVRNGRIGKVQLVHAANYPSPWECPLPEQEAPDYIDWDMWCGQTEPRGYHEELYPPRVRGHEAGWISYVAYSGGEMTGWGAHGFDQIQWALGKDGDGPVEVWPELDKAPPEDGIHMGPRCQVRYRYADGTEIVCDDKGSGGGGLFEGEGGRINIERGKWEASDGVDTSEIPEDGVHLYISEDQNLRRRGGDTEMHLGNWCHCIRTRETPIADIAVGHSSGVLCHLGNIARWCERPLKWDPKAERFIDDEDANSYLEREQREPWTTA